MLGFTHQIGMGQVVLTFAGKPDETVRKALKANGYRWSPAGGSWWKRGVAGAADFIAWLQSHGEPKRPDGECWRCKSPKGFFRNHGAATPVYCDECAAEMPAPGMSRYVDRFDMQYEDDCARRCGL